MSKYFRLVKVEENRINRGEAQLEFNLTLNNKAASVYSPMRMPNLPKLILASRSPRRAEILDAVGWSYEIIVAGVDETLRSDERPLDYVQRLAVAKAEAVSAKVEQGLVLGADTTVVVDGQILGQPTDSDDARRILRLLNGRWHEVVTGVALVRVGRLQRQVSHQITRVRFAELTNDEIDWYVSTHEPMDKAGAYGVQGKAALFIEEIQGDYFNVMGLPIRLVYEMVTRDFMLAAY